MAGRRECIFGRMAPLLGLVALVALACIAAAAAPGPHDHLSPGDAGSRQQQEEAAAAREYAQSVQRANFQLPKMFDFERYKSAFRKRYASALEELVRLKIFMARSWRVFCSAVGFKHRKSGYYLALSERSDWTREEIERSENKYLEARDDNDEDEDQLQARIEAEKEEEQEASELLEPAELEAQLAEIERHADEPGYAELAAELRKVAGSNGSRRRQKRDASSGPSASAPTPDQQVRKFDIEQVFARSRETGPRPPRMDNRLASNNPAYEGPPELMTQGGNYANSASHPAYVVPEQRFITAGAYREYGHLPVRGQHKTVVSLMGHFWSYFGPGNVSPKQPRSRGKERPLAARRPNTKAAANAAHNKDNAAPPPQRQGGGDVVWVDHRARGCLAPVQDQRQCGSCYAFAVAAFFENAQCRETGKLAKFSEQYLLDCGGRLNMNGCFGGRIERAAEFFGNFGAELAAHYPYRQRAEVCPYAPETDMTHMGYFRLEVGQLSVVPIELLENYLEHSPMVVNLDTSGDFQEYGGGVWDGRKCRERQRHSMLLIGHGREDGEEYWLIRNSYGPSWGEAGHLKLNKNSNCIHPRVGWVWGSHDGGAQVRLGQARNAHVRAPVAKDKRVNRRSKIIKCNARDAVQYFKNRVKGNVLDNDD